MAASWERASWLWLAARMGGLAARWCKSWRSFLKDLCRNTTSVAGLIIIGSFAILAILAPVVTTPNEPNPYRMKKDMLHPLVPPGSPSHPLGTDRTGSDILYGLIWGTRLSISIALAITAAAVVVGVALGVTAGVIGGAIDSLLMRVTDGFFALPPYILAMAILASLGATLENLAITLILITWPRFARVIRSQVLSVKELTYVHAARATGASNLRVAVRHVLPNAISPVFVQASLGVGEIVLWVAGLSFIGLAPSNMTEWGNMVSLGQSDLIGGYWWPSVFAGIMIFLFVLGTNLLGDGLRDVLDPRIRHSKIR